MFGIQFLLGNYTVENKAKQSTVFVVSDSNSDDVSECLKLASDGEKDKVDGQEWLPH